IPSPSFPALARALWTPWKFSQEFCIRGNSRSSFRAGLTIHALSGLAKTRVRFCAQPVANDAQITQRFVSRIRVDALAKWPPAPKRPEFQPRLQRSGEAQRSMQHLNAE